MIKPLTQKRFFQASLVLLFFVSSVMWVKADETTDSEAVESSDSDYQCAIALSEGSIPILDSYEEFLTQYTKVDAPTSEQFENLMLFYRYVEDSIRTLYDSSAQVTGYNKTLSFSNQELSSCRQMRDGIIAYAQKLLPIFVSGSSTSKTTFELVDGLKIMNEDLRDMTLLFRRVFPGQFTEMSNALPCYAHQCLTK